MRTINDLIGVENQTITWADTLMKGGYLTVDNSFQRNYVWLPKHQIKLIETILMGYPIPEIYIWHTKTDSEGKQYYSIVDGQQRLGAIEEFIKDEYPLSKKYLDEANHKSIFCDKKFSELGDLKTLIWDFKLSLRKVDKSVDKESIKKMFLKLNSTNMTLNPQELRKAQFDGYFMTLAGELADNEFWSDYSIFNKQDVRRMNDVQMISSILMFFRLGITEDTDQENINKVYDLYNKKYDDRKEDKLMFEKMLKECGKFLKSNNLVAKFLRKKTHLYSLLVLVYSYIKKKKKITNKQVTQYKKFVESYDNKKKATQYFELKTRKEIIEYKKLSSTGTKSKTNRVRRDEILRGLIEA